LLGLGCAHCALLATAGVRAAVPDDWQMPARFTRPELATDEGGLWAYMDREETKLRRSEFLMRSPALKAYLGTLMAKLAGEHANDMRVYAVRTPWFNASMAPNGMMQVWSGLLLRVENEAQLAAVLGHEIGHYLQRHSVERLRDARSRSAFAMLLGMAGPVGLLGQVGMLAGAYAYSREHEREADHIGLLLMQRAGYDGREAAHVWENLRAELTAGPGGDPSKRSVLFASHPPTDERQAALAAMAGDGAGFTGQDEYQRNIEPFWWDLLEDELKRAQYDETVVLLDRRCAGLPQRADLRYFRGEARRLRAQAEDLPLARADFEAALALPNPPAQAHRSLGFLFRQQGDKAEALGAFGRYLQAAPDASDAGIIQSYLSELQT
jgi:hypothetical protein